MKRLSIKGGVYLLMFGYGLSVTMVAPLLPIIVDEFSLSLTAGGALNSYMNIGGMVGVIVSAVIADRVSKMRFHTVGYIAFILSMLLLSFVTEFITLTVCFFILGISSRIVDALANPLIIESYPNHSEKYLIRLHACIGVGAFIGPVLTELLLFLGLNRLTIFGFFSAFCAALLIVFSLFTDTGGYRLKAVTDADKSKLSNIVKDKGGWLLCLSLLFYSVHQGALTVWTPTYMEDVGAPGVIPNFTIAFYWGGITLGRILFTRFVKPELSGKLMTWGLLSGGVALTLAIIIGNWLPIFIGIIFTGVSAATAIPIILDRLCKRHPNNSGFLTSVGFFVIASMYSVAASLVGVLSDFDIGHCTCHSFHIFSME